MNSKQLDKTFDQYLDKLIEKKGMSNMPEEMQKEFKEKSKEMLVDQFNGAVLKQLPDDKLEEFEKALDNDVSNEELGKIIDDAGVDVKKTMEDVIEPFSEAVLNLDINNMEAEA